MVMIAGFIVMLVVILLGCWAQHCNHRTYTERKAILDLIFARDDWFALLKAYNLVRYDKHDWALLTFRDPMKLYPKVLEDLVRGR